MNEYETILEKEDVMREDLGKILEIKEVHLDTDKQTGKLTVPGENYFSDYGGYEIVTDKANIKFLIQDWQQCCERWGYISSFDSEEELKYYIGAILYDIKLVDKDDIIPSENAEFTGDTSKDKILSKWYKLDEFECDDFYQTVIFIDCYTSKGVFTLSVYNNHNSAYGHEVRLVINDEIKEFCEI